MEAYQCSVGFFFLVFLCVGSHAWIDPNDDSCPDPSVISPCVCSVVPGNSRHIDCSDVRDEDDLACIFSSSSLPTFKKLTIEYNTRLSVLRAGLLGNASFEEVYIYGGALEEVDRGFLAGSYNTAISIDFSYNWLTDFIFDDMSLFTKLKSLTLDGNKLSYLPPITSPTLASISVGENPFSTLEPSTFQHMPALETISIFKTGLNNILAGTFSGLEHLTWLSLGENLLTHIHSNAIQFTEPGASLYLDRNSIKYIIIDAIGGLTNGALYVYNNKIVELEEDIWRPMLEAGNEIDLRNNPLTCGCDIAWLLHDPTLLSLINHQTICVDGTLLVDINPDDIDAIC
ncbi:oplophorus-luciferin 2-monooxygenase non-catalytic subunit-like [Homarus americanus]|uniref:Oplophorus-luciferin 2-monooxygenase non-catalytic subunit-like 16 n=1 Tax=Homarus americanus TaxID=6706 RepID=A0A8J5JRM2_HOMAM|nr:oplophorus-luciferin 2-monooxygenase non-catalytic subunit-like [Homarus americanus]KAG7159658.1 Oplophorus-luciferin 2-monooxygenase non-catalytic subunit-like 16 [Homarus americanus]